MEDICKELSEVSEENLSKLFDAIKSIMGTTEDSFFEFFSTEVLLPIKYGIENYVSCDKGGECKVEYPFSLPEEMQQYKISKERARTMIIGNIVSLCLLGLVVVLLFFFKPVRFIYFAIQILSILYFLLFQDKNVIFFSLA